MKGHKHIFEGVGFSIVRPEGWISEPPVWARLAQEMRVEPIKALLEATQKAAAPLFYFQKPHQDPRQVIPTVQASIRAKAPGPVDHAAILAAQVGQLEKSIPGVEVFEQADDAEISGYRANLFRAIYALEWEIAGEAVAGNVLSMSIMIPTDRFYFTVGFSSDAEEIHATQDEMMGILLGMSID